MTKTGNLVLEKAELETHFMAAFLARKIREIRMWVLKYSKETNPFPSPRIFVWERRNEKHAFLMEEKAAENFHPFDKN